MGPSWGGLVEIKAKLEIVSYSALISILFLKLFCNVGFCFQGSLVGLQLAIFVKHTTLRPYKILSDIAL